MNETPRRLPAAPRIITDGFPEEYPIFWGPNQRILEDDVYVEPSGFVHKRYLTQPRIVRFITDAHEVDATPKPSCTWERFYIQAFYHRIPNTLSGEGIWNVGAHISWSHMLANSPVWAGVYQNHDVDTFDLIVTSPNVSIAYKTGIDGTTSEGGHNFSEVIGASEITGIQVAWRWRDQDDVVIGVTVRWIDVDPPVSGVLGIVGIDDFEPICPEDYYVGCPCLP